MTWVKSDDNKPLNRKIRPLSDGAYRLDDHALHYCARHETDGLIYQADFEEITLGLKAKRHGPLVTELEDARLWHPSFATCASPDCPANRAVVPVGAWAKHDYFVHNKTHAELESVRVADRKRKRTPAGIPSDTRMDSEPPVPSRPVPSRPVKEEISNSGPTIRSRGWRGGEEQIGEVLGRLTLPVREVVA